MEGEGINKRGRNVQFYLDETCMLVRHLRLA